MEEVAEAAFVGGLAFADAAMVDRAKIGIFATSIAAGLIGWLLVRRSTAHAAAGPDDNRPSPA